MSRHYRYKPEVRGADGFLIASAEGRAEVRAVVLSPVLMANTMPGARSEGSLCVVSDVYLSYASVEPGVWRLRLAVLSGKREPAELGDEEFAIRVCEWSDRSVVRAPEWVRDVVEDNMPSERIGEVAHNSPLTVGVV